ncbi:winged helix-turn-helix domain-containing protein [Streptomyces sp. NBC_00239]|uniref:winged helix-turn-helix domain-containing protein n=1 Tax=Streptomyces sp. NBC_00239 TaxID=2903640 RepID=UPI002E2BE501|nr:winged helix-turn-helix domain-containing protein [Streptomyces sp. NBC_00239]
MSWWQVDADTLAGGRFVVSPLAEALAGLKTLHHGRAAHLGERQWLDAHLRDYRDRLAGDPVTAALVRAALGRRWNATFLTPTPLGDGDLPFAEELERVRGTAPAAVLADLAESADGPLPPLLLHRDDLARRAAELLDWVWTETVLPSWPRRRRIIEADIVARTARLALHGWATTLNEMRPGMRWLGADRLQITVCDSPAMELSGVELMFVPVTLSQSWVCWDVPPPGDGRSPHPAPRTVPHPARRHAVVYPCSGVLVDDDRRPAPKALAALAGPARAALLTLLDTPKSTTQLVALTGLPLGSVGRHLRILREAHLIERRRAGRSVLYYRTAAGQVLVAAQHPGPAGP